MLDYHAGDRYLNEVENIAYEGSGLVMEKFSSLRLVGMRKTVRPRVMSVHGFTGNLISALRKHIFYWIFGEYL